MRKSDWNTIRKKYRALETNDHIVPFPGLNTQQMINKLKKVKFILTLAKMKGWFHTRRLTGAIPLAINLGIPLVVDEVLKDLYELEGFVSYNRNITEIFEDLLELSNDNYSKLKSNIDFFKEKICQTNRNRVIKLLIDNCVDLNKREIMGSKLKIENLKKDSKIHNINLMATISKE